jgi:hypothetical protein
MIAQLALIATALTGVGAADPAVTARVTVDSARHQVVVMVGPLRIPAATAYDKQASDAPVRFEWPVSGWAQGYRIELVDATGTVLPRSLLHHAGVANLDRRQLAYPMAERLFASGPEKRPLTLPHSVGIPIDAGTRLLLYYMLVNTGDADVAGAWVKLTVPWTPGTKGIRSVMPLPLDANPRMGSFDVPPGVSITVSEFTLPVGGRLKRLGGHLHDFGVELRLEDAETGKLLVRLAANRDKDGRLTSVRTERFLFKRGLHLEANRRYRVVGVYDNPTCAVIKRGAMAFMVGALLPDDMRRWPAVVAAEPGFARDVTWLYSQGTLPSDTEQMEGSGHEHSHGHGHAEHAMGSAGCHVMP